MAKLRTELSLFFIAMGFFTRIPMPTWVSVDSESLSKANRYFAVIGILVGILSATVYALSMQVLPVSVSIIFAMFTSIIITGAFHEDGLADSADGFGGGWTVADKLKIMKDSCIGSYGTVTLTLTLLLKFTLLCEIANLNSWLVIPALILAHCLSRVLTASIMFTETYVSESTQSKSKSVAQQQSVTDLAILVMTGLVTSLLITLFFNIQLIVEFTASLLLLRFLLIWFFKKQIGGYTGDTLGAAQQISELVCYLILLGALQ